MTEKLLIHKERSTVVYWDWWVSYELDLLRLQHLGPHLSQLRRIPSLVVKLSIFIVFLMIKGKIRLRRSMEDWLALGCIGLTWEPLRLLRRQHHARVRRQERRLVVSC